MFLVEPRFVFLELRYSRARISLFSSFGSSLSTGFFFSRRSISFEYSLTHWFVAREALTLVFSTRLLSRSFFTSPVTPTRILITPTFYCSWSALYFARFFANRFSFPSIPCNILRGFFLDDDDSSDRFERSITFARTKIFLTNRSFIFLIDCVIFGAGPKLARLELLRLKYGLSFRSVLRQSRFSSLPLFTFLEWIVSLLMNTDGLVKKSNSVYFTNPLSLLWD